MLRGYKNGRNEVHHSYCTTEAWLNLQFSDNGPSYWGNRRQMLNWFHLLMWGWKAHLCWTDTEHFIHLPSIICPIFRTITDAYPDGAHMAIPLRTRGGSVELCGWHDSLEEQCVRRPAPCTVLPLVLPEKAHFHHLLSQHHETEAETRRWPLSTSSS